jgi:hypothetical protein
MSLCSITTKEKKMRQHQAYYHRPFLLQLDKKKRATIVSLLSLPCLQQQQQKKKNEMATSLLPSPCL